VQTAQSGVLAAQAQWNPPIANITRLQSVVDDAQRNVAQ